MTASAKRKGTTASGPRYPDPTFQAKPWPMLPMAFAGTLRKVRGKFPGGVPAPRRAADDLTTAGRTAAAGATADELTGGRTELAGDSIRPAGELAGDSIRPAGDSIRPAGEPAADEPPAGEPPAAGTPSPAAGPSTAGEPSSVVPGLGWVAGRRARRVVWCVLAVQVTAVLVFALVYQPFDLAIYLWGGRAVTHGLQLYAVQVRGNWFTYPPFAAALFTPLSLLPPVVVGVAWDLGSVAALAWSARACLRLAGYQPAAAVTAAVTAAALLLEPVYHTLYLGQVNVILLALVLADLRRVQQGRPAGIGIGLAAAIKLIPGLFIVFLLATRRVRDAVTASAVFAACAAAGYAINPAASRLYWTRLFDDTGRVSATYISNQTPYAALARILGGTSHVGPWYLAISAALGLAGLTAAARLAARRDWLAAAALTGVTSLLVSPISWTHHWVWALPALLTLLTRAATPAARLTTAAAYALFITAPMWFTPWANDSAQLGFHWALTLAANSFLLAGLAYLTWMTIHAWRPQEGLQARRKSVAGSGRLTNARES
jgi:alpha-1,2-mannosyltransferase